MRNFLSGALSLVIFLAFCYGIYRFAKWQKLLPPWTDDPTPEPVITPIPAPTLPASGRSGNTTTPRSKPVIEATTSVVSRDKNGNV